MRVILGIGIGIVVLAGATATAAAEPGGKTATAPVKRGTCKPQAWKDAWPYLAAPADPWLAVADGKPIGAAQPTDRRGQMPAPTAVCDAAHDHCMRDCTWLVTPPGKTTATAYHVDPKGGFINAQSRGDVDAPDDFVAYRSVPVTRKNLEVGALVLALDAPARLAGGVLTGDHRADGRAEWDGSPMENHWKLGYVDAIDWDAGVMQLDGGDASYYLSVTRLVVLKYTAAGGVETVAKAKAPAVADVIGPATRKRTVADPWAQVGKDGQPIAVPEAPALVDIVEDCSAAADHCLRPWAWFRADGGDEVVVVRWTGTAFVDADDPKFVHKDQRMAWRTRPAREADLVAGAEVLLWDARSAPDHEAVAHARRKWVRTKVEKLDRDHTVTMQGDPTRHPAGNVRVMVLYWMPGDVATKVD